MKNQVTLKIKKLNIQHEKEASVYDQARAWNDVAPLTHESIKDISINWKEAAVLDVASGTGRVAEYFRNKARLVIGVDISSDMLGVAVAEKRLDMAVVASGEKLPFLANSFDLLYCRSALHYMDIRKALTEWVRVTKDGGWIIISDVSFEDTEVNQWYAKMLKIILKEMVLVPHQKIIRTFHALGQKRCDYKIHMVRGSLNDVLRRKHTSRRHADAVRRMLETAPEKVRQALKITKAGDDYEFDFGMTITRCNIIKYRR
ncbi:MAG: hypothetical protein A3C11_01815 [Candidatus Sungbacteria bacterium RIFCSPHIGHO2_02_FULL_49_12]|uniref:Methyltransferase type 11 domain-containing protein n=1 Tax=Candidatus Sungbacteria bacterium RIFCSPHIGHO2_02_FULL_49_12 TaxID=1802271 RepID=A0A1G2KMF0_9BACT|nr:MAG: hypothetical protein A3C11_01815 [Candidatus Sungbacteria bacterium RIFCSPHIGHO2_02_FULL_49_12]